MNVGATGCLDYDLIEPPCGKTNNVVFDPV